MRYFAVQFKYYGATNFKGSKYRLECLGDKKFVSYSTCDSMEDKIETAKTFLTERFSDKHPRQFEFVGSCSVEGLEVYLFDYAKGNRVSPLQLAMIQANKGE